MSKSTEETKKIHELQNYISKLENQLDEQVKIEVTANKQVAKITARLKQVKQELSSLLDKKEIRLSEHAVLRYFERVKKCDLQAIEKEIMTDELKETVRFLGGSADIKRNGYTIIIKNYIIVTIIGD